MTKIPLKKQPVPVPWQVWFTYISFDGCSGGKRRPVLITEVNGSSCQVLEITSQQSRYSADVPITDLYTAGLYQNSVVKVRTTRTISKESLKECCGTLSRDDRNKVKNSIDQWGGHFESMSKVQNLFRSGNPSR
jgi:Growth inhibitor